MYFYLLSEITYQNSHDNLSRIMHSAHSTQNVCQAAALLILFVKSVCTLQASTAWHNKGVTQMLKQQLLTVTVVSSHHFKKVL